MPIADNFNAIMSRIAAAAKRSGREPSSVKLIVVTKTVDVERIQKAVSAGATILGENRVQEAKEKIEKLGPVAQWHLIGRLQTNKAKYAVKLFNLIHSVDSLELAHELDKQAVKFGKIQDVLIEVSIAGEVMPTWLEANFENLSGRVLHLPKRQDVNLPINEQLIVELYSK